MSEKDLVCEKTVNGYTVKVYYDQDAPSPREWDNVGEILYLKNSRYTLGDREVDREEMERIYKNKNNICLPVFAYIHGSVVLGTSDFGDQWDSGQSGIIFVSKEKARKEYGRLTKKTMQTIREVLAGEVKVYSDWGQGMNYGYVLTDAQGNEIDSCWGYVGYDSAEKVAEEVLKEHGAYDANSIAFLKELVKGDKKCQSLKVSLGFTAVTSPECMTSSGTSSTT